MSRQSQSVFIGAGQPCPKCRRQMRRFGHSDGWKPRAGQPYHYRYWDCCAICHHMQHYDDAKVWAELKLDRPLTPEQKAAYHALKVRCPRMTPSDRRRWLAEQMGIDGQYAIVAEFDAVECATVVAICTETDRRSNEAG